MCLLFKSKRQIQNENNFERSILENVQNDDDSLDMLTWHFEMLQHFVVILHHCCVYQNDKNDIVLTEDCSKNDKRTIIIV